MDVRRNVGICGISYKNSKFISSAYLHAHSILLQEFKLESPNGSGVISKSSAYKVIKLPVCLETFNLIFKLVDNLNNSCIKIIKFSQSYKLMLDYCRGLTDLG